MSPPDIILTLFGPSILIEPRSLRGRAFISDSLQDYRASNGVVSFSTPEEGDAIGKLIRSAGIEARVL